MNTRPCPNCRQPLTLEQLEDHIAGGCPKTMVGASTRVAAHFENLARTVRTATRRMLDRS